MISLTADEKLICSATDDEVEYWLARSRAGDDQARERLCCWAYLQAVDYYNSRTEIERNLSQQDAEDLAADFFVEFEHSLPRMKSATRFSRHLLNRKLRRYLQRERKRYHRNPTIDSGRQVADETNERPWEHWSDVEWFQYRATLLVLSETDTLTRQVLDMRATGEGYERIADAVGYSEAALRMRVVRFYRAVRARYGELIKGRVT